MVMPVMSASWKASVPIMLLGTLAVIATSGTESMCALQMPVTRLVAPGPLVLWFLHSRRGARVTIRHMRGALLMSDEDVLKPRKFGQHIVQRHDGAPWQAEDGGDAFLDERL